MGKRIAVIAAHPDDEILGCGGSIARHRDEGDTVHVLIMAEGLTSREASRDAVKLDPALCELWEAAKRANDCVGSSSLDFSKFPDNRMDSVDRLDIIKAVEAFKCQYDPDLVYTHHSADLNIDHQRIHEAVLTAFRPQPGERARTLLCFETVSSTEWQSSSNKLPFCPVWFNSLTAEHMARKREALQVYHGEMRDFPHARSIPAIEALATWRGASVGTHYAEAFSLVRNIR